MFTYKLLRQAISLSTNIFLQISACGDTIPPMCDFPAGTTCSDLFSYCESDFDSRPNTDFCPKGTPGKVKDYCKAACGQCRGKYYPYNLFL